MKRLAGLLLVLLAAACSKGGDDPPPQGDGTPASGRWKPVRPRPLATAIEELEGIGYLTGSKPAPSRFGVTVHDDAAVGDGYNLYTSGHAPCAVLVDMEGRTLHEWRCAFDAAVPDFPPQRLEMAHFRDYFRRCHLFPNGDLLGIFEGHAMVKLDRDSRILWTYTGKPHHDLQVGADGTIHVLARTAHVLPRIHATEPVLEDFVVVLDAGGQESSRVSILECFESSGFAHFLGAMPREGDLLHTNTLEVLDGSLADRLPAFARGNVLISCLRIDTIAVLDLTARKVVWAATGSWRHQHQPTVLENGHLLLFDNLGGDPEHGRSRVLELDPVTRRIEWSYQGTANAHFETATCGSCQRLPNSNTLLTESDNGRAIEVDPAGRIVWEFVSPHRAGPDGGLIATLFELVRLPADFPLEWASRPPVR